MKKFLLLSCMSLLAVLGNAQVIFYVEPPSPLEGNYEFTFADGDGWGVADLTDPANSVSGEMVLIDDASGDENPEGCDPVINDLTDKVAILYRGSCEFGVKALNAQNAGAIAVVIINNLGGAPVAMGGGASGGAVTIPVAMISNVDGALLRDAIDAGGTSVFIGSKTGLYSNDLGMTSSDHFRAESFGVLQQLSQNDSEFSVEVGSWVRNYGTNDQSSAVLNCTIVLDGTELYNVSSDPTAIPSGDSVFIAGPAFAQSSYANGYYEMTYTITFEAADESDFDNQQRADFLINEDYFSMAALDEDTQIPVNNTNQFNGTEDNLYTCLFFEDPNASRIGVRGMNFSAGTSQNPEATDITGQFFEVFVYEWDDAWVDLDDADFNIADLDDIASAEYVYSENLQGENVYIPFEEPFLLEDDQRYLFCAQIYGSDIYPGFDTKTNYAYNVSQYRMPTSPLYLSSQWFALGYGEDRNPALSVRMFDAGEVSLVELPEQVELQAFPNPASETVHIPMAPVEGNIEMTILNMDGKVVDVQNVVMNGNRLDVDVTTFASGTYVINLAFADGSRGTINVMVTR